MSSVAFFRRSRACCNCGEAVDPHAAGIVQIGQTARIVGRTVGPAAPVGPAVLFVPVVPAGLAALVAVAALHLLHLFLELLGFAAQHFLFPALAEGLLLVLIGGQLLLAAGQLGQLLQRLVDLLRAAVGGRLLPGFILILFAVEFQVGQVFQIAARAARASTAAALRPECNLDIAERGFGALGCLQSLLLGRHGIVPFLTADLLRRLDHALRRVRHFLGIGLELRIGIASSRAFMRSASDLACAASFSSCSARNLASSDATDWSLEPFLYSFQVAAMISFCRCEIC